MSKALQGRFADTCLSRDCFVLVTGPGRSLFTKWSNWITTHPHPPKTKKQKKKITVYVFVSVTDGFCIFAARLCISGAFKIHCPFNICPCFGTCRLVFKHFFWFPMSVFSYSACPGVRVAWTGLQSIFMEVFAGVGSWGFWLRLVVLGLFCVRFCGPFLVCNTTAASNTSSYDLLSSLSQLSAAPKRPQTCIRCTERACCAVKWGQSLWTRATRKTGSSKNCRGSWESDGQSKARGASGSQRIGWRRESLWCPIHSENEKVSTQLWLR